MRPLPKNSPNQPQRYTQINETKLAYPPDADSQYLGAVLVRPSGKAAVEVAHHVADDHRRVAHRDLGELLGLRPVDDVPEREYVVVALDLERRGHFHVAAVGQHGRAEELEQGGVRTSAAGVDLMQEYLMGGLEMVDRAEILRVSRMGGTFRCLFVRIPGGLECLRWCR
jgi:hypothetical protein